MLVVWTQVITLVLLHSYKLETTQLITLASGISEWERMVNTYQLIMGKEIY